MPNGMYQYFLKVVPTVYTNAGGHTIDSNQFSVTEHYKSAESDRFRSVPGVFFFYDLSPIKVSNVFSMFPFTRRCLCHLKMACRLLGLSQSSASITRPKCHSKVKINNA